MRKHKKVIAYLLCIALIMVPITGTGSELLAYDMAGHWSIDAVKKCNQEGIMFGHNGYFRPDDPITRAEFSAMLNQAFAYQNVTLGTSKPFPDLDMSKWYAKHIQIAAALKYMEGVKNPVEGGASLAVAERSITREEAATMLSTVLRLPVATSASVSFTDESQISSWARGYVFALINKGYMKGHAGKVNPRSSITRAETAQLMSVICGDILENPTDGKGKVYANVTMRKAGASLSNATINGDLYITEGVGDGDVALSDVTINGRLLVAGAGDHSILVRNLIVRDYVVEDKPPVVGNQELRFKVVEFKDKVNLLQGVIKKIDVSKDLILLLDPDGKLTTFNFFKNESNSKINIQLEKDTKVSSVSTSVPLGVSGNGSVDQMDIHAKDVMVAGSVNIKPENVQADKDISVTIGDASYTGNGTGGLTSPPVVGSGGSGGSNPQPQGPPPTPVISLSMSSATISAINSVTLSATLTGASGSATVSTITGIRVSSNGGVYTVTYDGATAFSSITGNRITFTAIKADGSTHNAVLSLNIYDGQVAARAIQVNQENILRFNNYAASTTTTGLSKHYRLMEDVTLDNLDNDSTNTNGNWKPIGIYNSNYFMGSFDGGGHTLSGMAISVSGVQGAGMFAYMHGGTISSFGLINASVTSDDAGVGGLIGIGYNNLVQNCFTSATVTGFAHVGGLIGDSLSSTISACYATGDVSSTTTNTSYVGGLIGDNGINPASPTVTNTLRDCYATGNVSGAGGYVGGLTGGFNKSLMERCYATGEVFGSGNNAGGLVGELDGSTVSACYATGAITGQDYVGGLIGTCGSSTGLNFVQHCYAAGNITAIDDHAGGIAGSANHTTLTSSVALTAAITSSNGNVYRIVGDNPIIAYNFNCYARDDMIVDGSIPSSTDPTSNDGKDVPTTSAVWASSPSINWWEDTLGWDFTTVWEWNGVTDGLPILRNVPNKSLQDPTLPIWAL